MEADVLSVPAAQLERLRDLGIHIADVLRRADISRARFEASKAYVTTAEYFALWRAIEEIAPDLGVQLGGTNLQPSSVGSIAALYSATFGDALAKLARYKRLVGPERIAVTVADGDAAVQFDWLLAKNDPPHLLIDGTFASITNLARHGTGKPITPRRVELVRRRGNEVMLRKHFGCEIRFEAPADLLVFDEAALGEPFAIHSPLLLDLVVPGLEAALRGHRRRRTLVHEVRAALSQQMNGERPTLERAARTLGMSAHTLQRGLIDLGASYQLLLDDVRRRSARWLFAQTDLDVGEVAFLLGFEELSSFARAVQRWRAA